MIKPLVLGLLSALYFDPVQAETHRSSASGDVGPFVGETWFSGTVPIDANKKSVGDIFYWWFESRNAPDTAPIVLWLTGGPGCSSEIALFYENGPWNFDSDGKSLVSNPHSWNENANLVYVDQPIGTGFSKADDGSVMDTNEEEIADNMAQFMIHFLEKFPQLKHKDFYITGESYAGHYIPAISHNFLFKNKAFLTFNFKGLAIGNGMVDPLLQYPQYNTFALENKLISKLEYDVLLAGFANCELLIKAGVWPVALVGCQLPVTSIMGNPPKFNVYDIRQPCSHPPLCYDFKPADNLMLDPNIQNILGVSGRKWEECAMNVHEKLMGDWFNNLALKLTDILNGGTEVLVYSGDKDFICNWRGGEKWSNEVAWDGKDEYNKQSYGDWQVSGKSAGSLKTYKNLKFLRVFDAGHMVPMNQPEAAQQMIKELITDNIKEQDSVDEILIQ